MRKTQKTYNLTSIVDVNDTFRQRGRIAYSSVGCTSVGHRGLSWHVNGFCFSTLEQGKKVNLGHRIQLSTSNHDVSHHCVQFRRNKYFTQQEHVCPYLILHTLYTAPGFANRDTCMALEPDQNANTQKHCTFHTLLHTTHTAQVLIHTFQHGKFMHAHHCGRSSNVCVV